MVEAILTYPRVRGVPVLTNSMKQALKWLNEHGGNAVRATTRKGGRFYLAQGEIAPFTFATFKKLKDAGLIREEENRVFVV